ncbi:MAG: type II toxin-antitoxin system RelB/DinJ family antitoxin [Chitinispirillales bacterium]|jgi:DNA-damage-inducible protein J|nr:type II toxin-antitoxin system RelB/DinJ family antitoxin [Chitinispirillales bacterium]
MASVTIRVDEEVKKGAESLFGRLGISMSAAVNVFFRQAIKEQAIPFQVKAFDGYDEYFNEHNQKALEESIAQFKAGNVVVKTMAELEAMENE